MDSDHDHVYNIALCMRSDNQPTPNMYNQAFLAISETRAFVRETSIIQHQGALQQRGNASSSSTINIPMKVFTMKSYFIRGVNVSIPLASVDDVSISLASVHGVSSTPTLVDSLIVPIPFQNGSRHSLETLDIEYKYKPSCWDTCKIYDHTDEHCPKNPKNTTLTPVTDDGFVEVNQKGKGKHAFKPRHIDGVRLTKPKPNYFYRPIGKSSNVHRIKNEDAIDMSNSDELRHTDNTTLIPPRLPDTLPQVYHRRRPTLGLLILPSVLPFPPTIRRTARMSVLPIEPNLAERARISAINLDDYQLDPVTPPPSPSSPFSMAAYQRMIAETDPTRREEALTAYGTETGQGSVPVPETVLTVCMMRLRGQLHTILEDMDRYPNACLEELEAFLTLWDVKPRVEESSLETLSVDELITQIRQVCEDAEDRASNAQEEARQKRKETLEEVIQQIYPLAAVAVTHAASTQEETNLGSNSSQNKAYNYKEFRAVMHENFCGTEEGDRVKFASSTLLDGALTWWNVYVRSVTLDTAHATPWSDFKAMFIRKYCPRNEVKQMENELWNLKVKGTNLTAYNQRFQELILLCPEMVPKTDRFLERYIEGLPLNIKGNVTSSKPVDLHEAIEMAQGLMYQVVQELGENSGDKQKWNGNHYNHNNTNHTSNLNPNKRPEAARVFTAGQGQDIRPKAAEPHLVPRTKEDPKAKEDREVMLLVSDVRQNQRNPKGNNQASTSTQGGCRAPGRVYSLCAEAAVKDNNVVNGTFLINKIYASVLFDTGADRSFVSYAFSKYIDIPPTTLDTNYSVELADGKSLTTNTILRGRTLNLQNHLFKIDLLPIELGSFDVIVFRMEMIC
ncbi:reverse transcriptase domain-containing protein [Tanacetum coccineum]